MLIFMAGNSNGVTKEYSAIYVTKEITSQNQTSITNKLYEETVVQGQFMQTILNNDQCNF
jgi:hypothetical protein